MSEGLRTIAKALHPPCSGLFDSSLISCLCGMAILHLYLPLGSHSSLLPFYCPLPLISVVNCSGFYLSPWGRYFLWVTSVSSSLKWDNMSHGSQNAQED